MGKTIVIIHTTPVTVSSLKEITSDILRDYTVYNLLDDSMLPEIIAKGEITEGVKYRFNNLLMAASTIKPDAILCACSSIGELADSCKVLTNIPVLRIDAPMAEEAVKKGRKIGVAATFSSTLKPTENLILRKAQEQEKSIEIESLLIDGVNHLLSQGKEEIYDEIVFSKLKKLAAKSDVVVLAQASMARVLKNVPDNEKEKFFTSPASGIKSLKKLLEE